MKKSKLFEKKVALIEECLKEHEHVKVYHDKKIKDNDGIERQIDVLLEIDLGKRLGKQIVIIECKDWSRKVEVGDMGSFINNMESLNATKGIYVSSKGFQKGAIIKATNNSKDILLYTLDDINEDEVDKWMAIESAYFLDLEVLLNDKYGIEFNIKCNFEGDTSSFVKNINNVYLCTKFDKYKLNTLIIFFAKFLFKNKGNKLLRYYAENFGMKKIDKVFSLEQEIKFNNEVYLESIDNEIIKDFMFVIKSYTKVNIHSSTVSRYSKYSDNLGDVKAKVTHIEYENNYFEIINNLEEGKERFFIVDKNDLEKITEIFDLGIDLNMK